MDKKLLIRIFVSNALVTLVLALITKQFQLGEISNVFWFLFVAIQSIIRYYDYIHSGEELGINKDNSNYRKVDFNETIQCVSSSIKTVETIRSSVEHLGEVYFDGELIKRQKFMGISNMSISNIDTKIINNKKGYLLSTRPFLSITKIDNYSNYKVFIRVFNRLRSNRVSTQDSTSKKNEAIRTTLDYFRTFKYD